MKYLVVPFVIITLLLAACGSTPTEQPPSDLNSTTEDTYPGPQSSRLPTTTPDYPAPSEGSESEGGAKVITDYKPQPTDGNHLRNNVFIDMEASQILVMESFPIQVNVLLTGNLPDPCHELRVVPVTDETTRRVDLEVYSLTIKGKACITVIQPFEATISLGSFSGGTYEVFINDEKLGEFES